MSDATDRPHDERSSDQAGIARALCWLARRFTDVWDFIDRRQIDCWVYAGGIAYITIRLLEWSVDFAAHSARSDSGVAMILAAVWAPWNLVVAAALNFIFKARQGSFQ